MMSRPLLIALLLTSAAATPLTAHAYLTPEDVLDQEDHSTRFYDPPPTKREIQNTAEEQRRASEERRAAEQAALQEPDEEPAEEEPLHGAAPDEVEPDDEEPTTPAESTLSSEDQRLLQRIKDRERDAWLNAMGGETMHSGAPLSETGPGTVLAVLAIAGAIGETWRRVRRADRD